MKHKDKLIHLLGGTAIFILFSFFSITLAMLVVAIMGVGKEYYDGLHPDKHTKDGWDAYATLLGVPLGMLIIQAYKFLSLNM
jgi:uncharacterized membrane protein